MGSSLCKLDPFVSTLDDALPNVGDALPNVGDALPNVGDALPKVGDALPKLEEAVTKGEESRADGGSPHAVLNVGPRSGPPMLAKLHRVLLIEDDPATGAALVSFVTALGMTPCLATTLEEAEAALAGEPFCCVVLDKQLPIAAGAFPLTATGDALQRRIRAIDPRRNAGDQHILPILVVSGAASALAPTPQAAFMSRSFRDGATTYIPKPFDAETLTTEILGAMERAGRADHAACAALGPPERGRAPWWRRLPRRRSQ